MGRKWREQARGVAFHITGRTLDHWFEGKVAASAEQVLLKGIATSDALLLAHIVMPNHFHVVIRSGLRPLGWIMQPIMRRLALLVNQTQRRRGPVFEGRFRSHPCDSADHLRRAIVYVHNNALRKGLCEDVFEYAWQSHAWYCGRRTANVPSLDVSTGLSLFLNDPAAHQSDLRRDYLSHFTWRVEKDRCDRVGVPCANREPEARAGDAYFRDHFVVRLPARATMRLDLRDYAGVILSRIAPAIELDALRRPYLSRDLTRIRRELICALIQHGYQGRKVANLFRISDAVVSLCASQIRYAELPKKLKS
jgi:hypothetical protein